MISGRALARKIAQEWERTAFAVAALLFAIAVVMWCLGFGRASGHFLSRQQAPSYRTLLGNHAFAFLGDMPGLEDESKNPFVFETEIAPPRIRRPPKVEPEPEPVKPDPVKPEPVPERVVHEPTPQPQPVEPRPRPRPRPPSVVRLPRIVEYVYSVPGRSGERKGFVRVLDPAKKTKKELIVKVGDIVDGVKILSITDERLTVVTAEKKSYTVSFGGSQRVMILQRVRRP